MSRTAWVCDSCHTNNLADAAICRLCQRAPGSATGRVEAVTHVEVATRPEERPTFVQSRHTELPRPTITLAPVPPPVRPRLPRPPAPPPPPMHPPMYPPTRPPIPRRTGRRLVKLALSGAAVIVLLTNLDELGDLLPDLSPPGQEEAAATAPACPAAAAQWLPQGGPGSTLTAMYESTDHVVTVCQDTAGQFYYDGQKKGVEASDTTHIALIATQTATGFTADNGGTRYEINGLSLTITTNGVLQHQWPLTQVAP